MVMSGRFIAGLCVVLCAFLAITDDHRLSNTSLREYVQTG